MKKLSLAEITTMRKTDKKLDNQLRKKLTDICENKLAVFNGFQWLTHNVNYLNFPDSLEIICVFDTNERLAKFLSSKNKSKVSSSILKSLLELDIKLSDANKHIMYDSEENCSRENNGNWLERLA